jgi:hypothetical protein
VLVPFAHLLFMVCSQLFFGVFSIDFLFHMYFLVSWKTAIPFLQEHGMLISLTHSFYQRKSSVTVQSLIGRGRF